MADTFDPRIENQGALPVWSTLKIVFGIVPIVAGLGLIATRWTRVFAWVVGIWLLCIALDLIAGGFYDIAVRDIVMAISAFCLARLSAAVPAPASERSRTVETASAR